MGKRVLDHNIKIKMADQNQKLEEVVRYFNEKLKPLVDRDPELEVWRNVPSPADVTFCLGKTFSPNAIVEIGLRYNLDQKNRPHDRSQFEEIPISLNDALSPIEVELYADSYFRGENTTSRNLQIFSCRFRGDKIISTFINHGINPVAEAYSEHLERLDRGTNIRKAIDLAFQMYADTSIGLEGEN